MNFENVLGNRCIKGLQGICDSIKDLYGEIVSDGKANFQNICGNRCMLTVSGKTSQTSYDTGNV